MEKWPGDPVVLFGLGNLELAAGNNAAAETYYRALIGAHTKSAAARNNLAIAVARQGRFEEAMKEISLALDRNSDPALEDELLDTKGMITDMSQTAASHGMQ